MPGLLLVIYVKSMLLNPVSKAYSEEHKFHDAKVSAFAP